MNNLGARIGFALALALAAPAASAADKPKVSAIEAVDGTFRATLSDNTIRSGAELVGVTLVYSNGEKTLHIKLAGVRPDPTGQLLLHDFRDADTGKPSCTPSADGVRAAFVIAGRTDSAGNLQPGETGAFEIACTSGAQGKCLRFGYLPWKDGPDGKSNLDRFNACVHMVRGDYCGDGKPTTRDGTPIDIFDDAGIRKPTRAPGFTFEAAWTAQGAACVAHVRIRRNISLAMLAKTCPRLAGRLGPQRCKEGAVTGDVYNLSR
jgi:hypothetical protein